MESFYGYWQKFSSYFLNLYISSNYIQAIAIAILLFFLVLTLASVRKHFVHWSLKGGIMGLVFGVLLTLIVEGFLLISGHTVLTSLFGWNNPPKPISTALDKGRAKFTSVLGFRTENPSASDIVNLIQLLNPSETRKIKGIICTP